MKIIYSPLENNRCFKTNRKIKVQGIMLHSVGCPQPDATVFLRNWNKESAADVCVHAFIDGVTGVVYQTLPWTHRAWHCGAAANNTHIAVEMCEPASIKYFGGASLKVLDSTNAKEIATRTYNTAVELFAKLCTDFNLDPVEKGVIISHSEGYKSGVASNHADPEHLWKQLNLPYTMDGFRKDVKNSMNINNHSTNKKTYYRVQVGSFSKKENANNMVAKLKKAGFDAIITTVEM